MAMPPSVVPPGAPVSGVSHTSGPGPVLGYRLGFPAWTLRQLGLTQDSHNRGSGNEPAGSNKCFRWPSPFLCRSTRGLRLTSHLMSDRLPRVCDGPLRVGGWTGKGRLGTNLMLLLHAPCLGLGFDNRVFQLPHTARMSKRTGRTAPAAVAIPATVLYFSRSANITSKTCLISIVILVL